MTRPILVGMARAGITVESSIERVTVYANGARVRRVASLRAPLPAVVRVAGLPLTVIDDTVRSEVDGGATASAIRVGIDTPSGESRPEQSEPLRAARQRAALAEAEVERLREALERLAAAPLVEDDPSDAPPAAWHAIVTARRELVGMRVAREAALRDQRATAVRELDDARRALEVIAEREQRASSAQAARAHEVRKYVELELTATTACAGDVVVRVEYQIAGARWAPSYVARLDGDATRFELRAVVAQTSGEDWTGVALRLSTAEPERFTQLPELAPQKIGRRQDEPAHRGFRAPPAGSDVLYTDYDRSFPRAAAPLSAAMLFEDSTYEGRAPTPPEIDFAAEVWDEESSRAKQVYSTPPTPYAAVVPPSAAPASLGAPSAKAIAQRTPMPSRSAPRSGAAADAAAAVGGRARRSVAAPDGFAVSDGSAAPGQIAPAAPRPLLDYANLRMAPPTAHGRGTLVAAPAAHDPTAAARTAAAIARIAQLPLPPGHVGTWAHAYDYAFASDGAVDIASDGAWHSIALTSRAGSAKLRHVAVPREQADVFRVATLTNPLAGPLLPGPIDVYDRDQFLVTSEVDYTPPGGSVEIGLGVDPAVKIARNVEFHEEAAGVLRGSLRLVHAITIDVENHAAGPIDLEVRERVPVTREGDDDVEVTLGKIEPPWERLSPDPDAPKEQRLRGGQRWRITVPAAAKQRLRAGYEIKIASKHELVGGNRRER